jgi:hypothetical protein
MRLVFVATRHLESIGRALEAKAQGVDSSAPCLSSRSANSSTMESAAQSTRITFYNWLSAKKPREEQANRRWFNTKVDIPG